MLFTKMYYKIFRIKNVPKFIKIKLRNFKFKRQNNPGLYNFIVVI